MLNRLLQRRLSTLRQVLLAQRWVRAVVSVWALIAVYDTFSSQIAPEWLATRAPKVREVIAVTSGWLPFWGWLLILAALLVIASFEYLFGSPVVMHLRHWSHQLWDQK